MIDKQFSCQECEAEFAIEHEELDEPSFCPFCGSQLDSEDKEDDFGENWDDVDEGC